VSLSLESSPVQPALPVRGLPGRVPQALCQGTKLVGGDTRRKSNLEGGDCSAARGGGEGALCSGWKSCCPFFRGSLPLGLPEGFPAAWAGGSWGWWAAGPAPLPQRCLAGDPGAIPAGLQAAACREPETVNRQRGRAGPPTDMRSPLPPPILARSGSKRAGSQS